MAELERLPAAVRGRLLDTFDQLARWPNHDCDVRKLSGPFKGLWRVRVGDYRALFDVDATNRRITITRTGKRQRVYG
jgi:mRNA-degrading endonuclease RelE of RelBE toxin-antitoxin system